jgi:hypothetical protein
MQDASEGSGEDASELTANHVVGMDCGGGVEWGRTSTASTTWRHSEGGRGGVTCCSWLLAAPPGELEAWRVDYCSGGANGS